VRSLRAGEEVPADRRPAGNIAGGPAPEHLVQMPGVQSIAGPNGTYRFSREYVPHLRISYRTEESPEDDAARFCLALSVARFAQ
jgi:hypothetical protein